MSTTNAVEFTLNMGDIAILTLPSILNYIPNMPLPLSIDCMPSILLSINSYYVNIGMEWGHFTCPFDFLSYSEYDIPVMYRFLLFISVLTLMKIFVLLMNTPQMSAQQTNVPIQDVVHDQQGPPRGIDIDLVYVHLRTPHYDDGLIFMDTKDHSGQSLRDIMNAENYKSVPVKVGDHIIMGVWRGHSRHMINNAELGIPQVFHANINCVFGFNFFSLGRPIYPHLTADKAKYTVSKWDGPAKLSYLHLSYVEARAVFKMNINNFLNR